MVERTLTENMSNIVDLIEKLQLNDRIEIFRDRDGTKNSYYVVVHPSPNKMLIKNGKIDLLQR